MISEGRRRGYSFEVLRHGSNIIRVSKNGSGFIYKDWPGYLQTQNREDRYVLRDKDYQKQLMSAYGLPVPKLFQIVRDASQIDHCGVSLPVVCKPRTGCSSYKVFTHIRSVAALVRAVDAVTDKGDECLIEAHVTGRHYRLLVYRNRLLGCVERRPASITGDGVHTVEELVALKNQEPNRRPADDFSVKIHHLILDDHTAKVLAERGWSTRTIPPLGEQFFLQTKILMALGADLIDATDSVHPDTRRICQSFANDHRLPLVGFDLIIADVNDPYEQGWFNEINVDNVAMSMNESCNIGAGQPISKDIWDAIESDGIASPTFPEY